MRVVLDTSVLVAAARSRRGASHRIVAALPHPRFQIALSVALYTEWQAVLTRPEHRPSGLGVEDVLDYLRYLASIAHLQDVHYLWHPFLRDPDDDMVLECAAASGSRYLITHNVADFRGAETLGAQAVTPAWFWTEGLGAEP
ncbi:putative toxin-antitoxin system toxin component, PIN family [Tepidimonas alkaliphilus]|uniref:Putative toxin-antitoxin system toxin component, PIN family n=1 Tax=Tepidimonas alkaliphilus TaxID=2588942 RepID=A0A554W7A1_9BURK|nr:putative toxin-antitoxin system toxin component, PIN family [Tepidimonas alkaliphilus]TSE19444.1 putative toxin-antitoxin system toxin component, PIN family [Tepidimonas alkaliphilus]